MSKTRIVLRGIMRVLRSLAWVGLIFAAGLTFEHLERLAKSGGANLASIEFDLTELFAVFCAAVAVDRALSLSEKRFEDPA